VTHTQGESSFDKKTFQYFFLLNVLVSCLSYSQLRTVNALSVVEKFELPSTPYYPHLLRYSSQQFSDLVFYNVETASVIIAQNNGNGHFIGAKVIGKTNAIISLSVGAINNDGLDDIVLVHREQNQIEVLLSNRSDSTYTSALYTVGYYPEKIIIGDITNDQIPDIICYGKLSSGISVLQGKGNGTFREARTLFPGIPVGDFSIVKLNNDGIADIVIQNWLTNEVAFYFGTGNLKFSEQTVLSFGADSVSIVYADFNNDEVTDVAFASTQHKTIQIYHGDGLGSFNFSQTVTLFTAFQTMTTGAIQSPTTIDIIGGNIERNLFSLFLNRGDGSFYDEIIYGVDSTVSRVLIGDINGDGLSDALLIGDSRTAYSIIWNEKTIFPGAYDQYSLAVGKTPNNLFVTDLNGDGLDDIIVSNENSSTISMLMSKGRNFAGQISVEIPGDPASVSLYAKNDTSLIFFTSHHRNPKISLVSLIRMKDSLASLAGDVESYSIQLPERPVTVLPDISYLQKGISLYAFMSSATNAIVFYQQVKGTRFLAKSLVPLIPSKIIYSTISDLNLDGRTDLLYVYYDAQAKNNVLGVTLNDTTGEYKGKVTSFVLPDTTIRRAFLFVDDFNGDFIKDCLLYTSPNNTLSISLGTKDTSFSNFNIVAAQSIVRSAEQIQIYDYDGDGIQDILIADRETSELSFIRGKGNGTFFAQTVIMKLPTDAIFRCGDFNGDSVPDIVYTNPNSHTVTVAYGKSK